MRQLKLLRIPSVDSDIEHQLVSPLGSSKSSGNSSNNSSCSSKGQVWNLQPTSFLRYLGEIVRSYNHKARLAVYTNSDVWFPGFWDFWMNCESRYKSAIKVEKEARKTGTNKLFRKKR